MIERKETKLIVENWRKLLKENNKLDKRNKTITEAADIMQMLSDIGSQIAQYSPAIIGTVAAGAGVSKIKSSFEKRRKKNKIAELSTLFIERFISEINEDINNDLKANEAKEKYREGQDAGSEQKSSYTLSKNPAIDALNRQRQSIQARTDLTPQQKETLFAAIDTQIQNLQ